MVQSLPSFHSGASASRSARSIPSPVRKLKRRHLKRPSAAAPGGRRKANSGNHVTGSYGAFCRARSSWVWHMTERGSPRRLRTARRRIVWARTDICPAADRASERSRAHQSNRQSPFRARKIRPGFKSNRLHAFASIESMGQIR
jgi:hypothetical protein